MTGCEFEYDRAVTEHVVIAFYDLRFAVLESGICGVDLHVRAKHHVVVTFVHEECRTRKIVGVADMIRVRMRQRQVIDLRRLVSYRVQLTFHRLGHEDEGRKSGKIRRVAKHRFIEGTADIAIAEAGVKKQSPWGVNDQIDWTRHIAIFTCSLVRPNFSGASIMILPPSIT